jgi:hypothetical protein
MSPEIQALAMTVTPWLLPDLRINPVTHNPEVPRMVKINLERVVDYMRLNATGDFSGGKYIVILGAPEDWPDDTPADRTAALELALSNAWFPHVNKALQAIVGMALRRLAAEFAIEG